MHDPARPRSALDPVKVRFHTHRGLILVRADVFGLIGPVRALLALDTGAARTVIGEKVLIAAGHNPAMATTSMPMTSATGSQIVPLVCVDDIRALGQTRNGLIVAAHTVPPSTGIDGLLGLDFFRDSILTIDFRAGFIEVS